MSERVHEPWCAKSAAVCNCAGGVYSKVRLDDSWLTPEARAADVPTGEEMYPCRDCGLLRTKAEGGTTFTVCDECWDKAYAKHRTTPNAPTAKQSREKGDADFLQTLAAEIDAGEYTLHWRRDRDRLREIAAALLAARREVEAAQQRLSEIAVLCRQTEEVYADDADAASFYATTLDKIAALAATQEGV